ncbi:helix-turn-helix domain-containing protein [Ligilactobacillus sp. WILCCON 0076]|uniref:Helix-turn-helix domain-containing protein n=1 Tax=Ligilactobacillus ubinensis TaxID=2876789 RepID=A0A9X2FJL5_9LACO|nr:helix-turn-helix domain-containing protein [Ligilactobacillus ubinensis]MCP0886954.1 helix-turn-helix domain-containing protein [Ligilactobacillus ubinensis]
MSEQPSYFSILTASVRYDKNLKPNEKLLFSEITALSNKYGYCTASNSYFAKLYEVDKSTISRWISNLQKYGYVHVELIKENQQVKQRKIYPSATPLLTKKSIPYAQNNQYPIDEKIKENNTSINNININNNNNNNGAKINAFETLQKAGIRLNGITAEPFLNYVNELGDDVVDFAITKMCETAAHASWGYLEKILTSYETNGVKTLVEAKALENRFKNKRQQPNSSLPNRGSEINGVSF